MGKKKKRRPGFHFPTHVYLGGKKEKKKKNLPAHVYLGGKKKKKPTGTRLLGREKKKLKNLPIGRVRTHPLKVSVQNNIQWTKHLRYYKYGNLLVLTII